MNCSGPRHTGSQRRERRGSDIPEPNDRPEPGGRAASGGDADPPFLADALAEVPHTASELIAIDTTNVGDVDALGRERPAAQYVAERLSDAGYLPTYLESGARGRGNVVVRLTGSQPARPALLVHGHLDVVPADPAEWSVHPFSGEIRDGYVWGRGAVDMKGTLAAVLALARQYRLHGVTPRRDLIFAFLADEEAGGTVGARWLVEHRPDLFADANEAVSEVGGFSVSLPNGARAYLVETAEKSVVRLDLTARGRAGHASMIHPDNAVARLAAAVARLHEHRFPVVLTEPMRLLLEGIADLSGIAFEPSDPQAAIDRLGPVSRLLGAALRDTANLTVFDAGYKKNVIPSVAHAHVNGRVLPGRESRFIEEVAEVLGPEIELCCDQLPAVQTEFDGALVEAMAAAVNAEDPGARLLPYLLSAATDAKSFARLGIRHFGFAPLRLPAGLDFTALFHGVDERVPVDALLFGTRVLDRLLRTC